MGLCPLRGPLSSAAVPRLPGAEASGFRCSPALPKQGGVPGKVLRTGHPVRWASVRSPQRVARGFRSIPSWVARDAPSRDCSLSWFRRAAPEVCPGARVASRTSVGAASHCWMVFRRRCLAGLHGVFDVKDLKCRLAVFELGIRTDGLALGGSIPRPMRCLCRSGSKHKVWSAKMKFITGSGFTLS
jgi:hypothetical protein